MLYWVQTEREFLFDLFEHRCMGLEHLCNRVGTDLSHIIPRSRGNIAKHWTNIGLHCRQCHSQYHAMGASEKNIQMLQEARERLLIELGKGEYA